MLQGVVFDLDGTLLDTEKLYRRFWVEAARQMGYPMEDRHALMIRSMAAEKAERLLRREVCAEFDYHAVRALRREQMEAYIDENGVVKFKGFLIEEVPDDLFQTGEVAYVYIDGVGKAFTGINTARTIESEDFDGVALQGAGKAGEFILPDNKKAVCKVLLNSEYGLDNLTVTSAASSTTVPWNRFSKASTSR